jgi:bifunctional non-homologous end joining protein LigD
MAEGVVDGEIVAVDSDGKPSFQALQHAAAPRRGVRPIYFFAFNLLNLDRKDLTSLSLLERKRLLQETLDGAPAQVRFAGFLEGEPRQIWTEICDLHLEGIVAKVASSRYEPGKRSGAWVKIKCGHEQEFVIGGYTQGKGKRASFGALIVGYRDGGKLRYASKVGTGFSNRQIR